MKSHFSWKVTFHENMQFAKLCKFAKSVDLRKVAKSWFEQFDTFREMCQSDSKHEFNFLANVAKLGFGVSGRGPKVAKICGQKVAAN